MNRPMFADLSETNSFKLTRYQVYNWGTFSGLADIPISPTGYLIVGPSGSGKSTLLDGISALLIPPQWVNFNSAAREGEKARQDRNLITYVRGAWSERTDESSGEASTQYLRRKSTWSALALEYTDDEGRIVSLVQIFYVRGSTTANADVKRHFMIAERPFSIEAELHDFDLDIRALKKKLKDDYHAVNFKDYSERFRRLIHIESDMALKLLHKTQSAKNLGDLNTMMREFMLDKPDTFQLAEKMSDDFVELESAYQEVVRARRQMEVLLPARESFQRYETLTAELAHQEGLKEAIAGYGLLGKRKLLEARIAEQEARRGILEERLHQSEQLLKQHRNEEESLQDQFRDHGGQRIIQLQADRERVEAEREKRLATVSRVEQVCQRVDWGLPSSPEALASLTAEAKEYVESGQQKSDSLEAERDQVRDQLKEIESEFKQVSAEARSLRQHPSNIPARMLELRQRICEELNLREADLPFVGELIEVEDAEKEVWQGAIERLLHNFALSLLVTERHYSLLTSYVNQNHIGSRIVFYRVGDDVQASQDFIPQESVLNKLTLKDGPFQGWLEAELQRRFNYPCVSSVQQLRKRDLGMTQDGLMRHGKSRHEKDDRCRIDDKRHWVLGFDNREKLALYEERAAELAAEITKLNDKLEHCKKERERLQQRLLSYQDLVNVRWQDIDVASVLAEIHAIDTTLEKLLNQNAKLDEIKQAIQRCKQKIEETWERVTSERSDLQELVREVKGLRQDHAALIDEIGGLDQSRIAPYEDELSSLFADLKPALSLKNYSDSIRKLERLVGDKMTATDKAKSANREQATNRFTEFKHKWPEDAADLDHSIESAPEYMVILKKIEIDRLPSFEDRFFSMLRERSFEKLATLSRFLTNGRREIRERMELVNQSLRHADFNPGTYLQIEVSDRNLEAVASFRQKLSQILDHAFDDSIDLKEAEAKFATLKDIVHCFRSPEAVWRRWREQVLDVRQHVEFIGREYDEQDREQEVYRSGAGKSGGQREKLATTCLAAALRYQLGGTEGGWPRFAPVVLDEAFAKADNDYTSLVMQIFKNFGFQMIIATPVKSVMTLQRFIGGACYVSIADRKDSSVTLIRYDESNKRLQLPSRAEDRDERDIPQPADRSHPAPEEVPLKF
jgi:uncharacterized protein YPO0396